MTMLVDTSVWSLAFRRDAPVSGPEVLTLRAAFDGGDAIVTTGLVLQELLQGLLARVPARTLCSVSRPCRSWCRIDRTTLMLRIFATFAGGPGSRSGRSTRCWASCAYATN
jgi:hypothetical protein